MVEEEKKEEENIGSFYIGRTRPPPVPKRFLPPGVLTLIALTALGGIIWYAYPRGADRYTNLDVPVVKADTAPIKEKPENPGGMEVSHQDSTVFDPLQKSSSAEIEKLTPAPEQPLDKDQALKSDDIKPIAPSPSLPPKLDLQVQQMPGGAEEIIPKAPEAKPPSAPENIAAAAPLQPEARPEIKHETAAKPKPEAAAKPAEAKHAEVKPKTEEKKAPQKEEEKAAASADYEVQLGSYREEADAKKDWPRLQKKYAAQLANLKMRLVKADVPGKGIYYRMRAGVITKDKAHAICDALKAAHGVGCILAKR